MIVAITPGWVKTGAYYFQLHDVAGALQCMKTDFSHADMGTEDASLTLDESVPRIVHTLTSLKPEDNGRLIDYRHEILPW